MTLKITDIPIKITYICLSLITKSLYSTLIKLTCCSKIINKFPKKRNNSYNVLITKTLETGNGGKSQQKTT